MVPRRVAAATALAILLVGAAMGLWRSARTDGTLDPAHRLGSELRCPACQGESVADSRSPIAAAMRDVIDEQLAQGRDPADIRAYLVRRYGPEVLAAPAPHGLGLLLWVVPACALIACLAPVVRAGYRSRRPIPTARLRTRAAPTVPGPRIWNISAICLLALVGGVALATPGPTPPRPTAAFDPVPDQLALGRAMADQGRYDAAAEIYRTALLRRPADDIRLQLAFTLIRAGQATEAAHLAGQVLANQPDAPDALLLLGLAQREADPEAAPATLRRFLARAPEHPAAPEIRRLLGTG